MLYYGTAGENISDLKIIASKVADIRDDVMYMSNRAMPITSEEWKLWSRSSNSTVLQQLDKMLHDMQTFINVAVAQLKRHNKERDLYEDNPSEQCRISL